MELSATFITSKQNKLFKEWLTIFKRKKRDFCLVEGERIVKELYASPSFVKKVECLILTPDFWQTEQKFLLGLFANANLSMAELPKIYVLATSLYKQISTTVQSQGIIAVLNLAKLTACNFKVEAEQHELLATFQPAVSIKEREIVLVLDQVQDPGNLGNIIRAAAAFGVRDIYLLEGTVHAWQDKVLRSTMGGIFKVNIVENQQATTLFQQLKANNYTLLAAALAKENIFSFLQTYPQAKLKKLALIMGNEGNGVSQASLDAAHGILTIPMLENSESLNVASATAICLAELRFH